MSDTGQPEDGRCKHVITEQLGTRFLTRKEAAILRRRPKKEIPAHEPSAGTEGDAELKHKWVGRQVGGSPVNTESFEWVRFCSVCGMEDSCEDEDMPPCPGAAPQPSRPEPAELSDDTDEADAMQQALDALMEEYPDWDALADRNIELTVQLESLKQSHAALVELGKEAVEWLEFSTPEEYSTSQKQKDFVSRLRAALADAKKVTG